MNKLTTGSLLIILGLTLSGCVGIGVVKTSNPMQKLNDAERLYVYEDRPALAEGLILEAIEIFEEQNNHHWLGHANRDYGEFLISGSVERYSSNYQKWGFTDQTITFANRQDKAIEKFKIAIEHYKTAENIHKKTKTYDALTNVYFNLAWSSYRINDIERACQYYDKTLEAYHDNLKQNPTATPHTGSGKSVEEEVDYYKKRMACDENI